MQSPVGFTLTLVDLWHLAAASLRIAEHRLLLTETVTFVYRIMRGEISHCGAQPTAFVGQAHAGYIIE